MAMEEELVRGRGNAATIDGPGSPDWWQSRSTDELQAIYQRGIHAGDWFIAAATEIERRARESEAAREAEQFEEIRTLKRLRWEVWALIVLAAVTILLLMLRG